MKITHHDLIIFIKASLNMKTDGVCKGVTGAAMQAAFLAFRSQDPNILFQHFFSHLHELENYKNHFDQFKRELKHAKQKTKKFLLLNKRESTLLKNAVFLAQIYFYQAPERSPDFFGGKYVSQDQIEQILPLVQPTMTGEIIRLHDISYGFNREKLLDYFRQLKNILHLMPYQFVPVFIEVGSSDHSVFILYNKHKQLWIYVDTNDFESYPKIHTYYREINSKLLVEGLFDSLVETSDKNLIRIEIISNIPELKKYRNEFFSLNSQFLLTRQQALLADYNQFTLLHMACRHQDLTSTEILLGLGAEINKETKSGKTPVAFVCRNGNLSLLLKLIEYGADINPTNSSEGNPFLYACRNGYVELVKELIARGVDVNQQGFQNTSPLNEACKHGHLSVVKELLQQKNILVHTLDLNRMTPFLYACLYHYTDIAKLLLAHPNVQENLYQHAQLNKAMFYAADTGNVELIEILLTKMRDRIEANQFYYGRTMLLQAARRGHTHAVQFLLKKTYIIFSYTDEKDNSLLMWAASNGDVSLIRRLLMDGRMTSSHINQVKTNGKTALMYALRNGHADAVEVLLNDSRLIIDFYDQNNNHMLLRAAYKGHSKLVKLLLTHPHMNADIINAPHSRTHRTALMSAVLRNHEDIVELLLSDPRTKIDLSQQEGEKLLARIDLYRSPGREMILDFLVRSLGVKAKQSNQHISGIKNFRHYYSDLFKKPTNLYVLLKEHTYLEKEKLDKIGNKMSEPTKLKLGF